MKNGTRQEWDFDSLDKSDIINYIITEILYCHESLNSLSPESETDLLAKITVCETLAQRRLTPKERRDIFDDDFKSLKDKLSELVYTQESARTSFTFIGSPETITKPQPGMMAIDKDGRLMVYSGTSWVIIKK